MPLRSLRPPALDDRIVDAAGEIFRRWNPSHGTDAILVATAQATGGKIYCLNTKHYPLPDLIVERAWH